MFSADDVVHGKPAPDLYLHAAAVMGVDPSRCVVVEDSRPGTTAALAAGMRVLGYAGGLTPGHWLGELGGDRVRRHARGSAAGPGAERCSGVSREGQQPQVQDHHGPPSEVIVSVLDQVEVGRAASGR